jgi:hypothetical protein
LRDRPRRYLLVSVGTIFRTDMHNAARMACLQCGRMRHPRSSGREQTRRFLAISLPRNLPRHPVASARELWRSNLPRNIPLLAPGPPPARRTPSPSSAPSMSPPGGRHGDRPSSAACRCSSSLSVEGEDSVTVEGGAGSPLAPPASPRTPQQEPLPLPSFVVGRSLSPSLPLPLSRSSCCVRVREKRGTVKGMK